MLTREEVESRWMDEIPEKGDKLTVGALKKFLDKLDDEAPVTISMHHASYMPVRVGWGHESFCGATKPEYAAERFLQGLVLYPEECHWTVQLGGTSYVSSFHFQRSVECEH